MPTDKKPKAPAAEKAYTVLADFEHDGTVYKVGATFMPPADWAELLTSDHNAHFRVKSGSGASPVIILPVAHA